MAKGNGQSFNDFSKGVTDYFFQGDIQRYQHADNFELTNDKKLSVRPGSEFWLGAVQGKFYIPNEARIDAFMLFLHEKELLSKSGSKIYEISRGNWTLLAGPAGNDAAPGAIAGGYLYSGELATTLYFTGDGMAHPSYIFKDENMNYQVRTLGLPIPKVAPKYTDSSLLQTCITLANNLRAQMILHLSDTGLHVNDDRTALSFFQSVVFRPGIDIYIPAPYASPAPAATDEASLYTLINSLIYAYGYHLQGGSALADSGFGTFLPNTNYHHSDYNLTQGISSGFLPIWSLGLRGPNIPHSVSAVDSNRANTFPNLAPTTLEAAASFLDELKMKYNWHRKASWTHSPSLIPSNYDFYPASAPDIGTIDLIGAPIVTPDYSQFYGWVYGLKVFHNNHVSNGRWSETAQALTGPASVPFGASAWHIADPLAGNLPIVPFPKPTNLGDAYLSLFWTRMMYANAHIFDADVAYTSCTYDSAGNTADVTDVKNAAGTLLSAAPNNQFILASTNVYRPTFVASSQVVTAGLGTATMAAVLNNSGALADAQAQFTQSLYHFYDATGNRGLTSYTNAPSSPIPSSQKLSNALGVGLSIEEWVVLGQELLSSFQAHTMDFTTHKTVYRPGLSLMPLPNNFYDPEFADYEYAAIFRYRYKDQNSTEFEQVSEPMFWSGANLPQSFPISAQEPNSINTAALFSPSGAVLIVAATGTSTVLNQYPNLISNLPVLVNDSTTNYDVTKVDMLIYRTSDAGKVYYLLDTLTNGTTTDSDNVNDLLANPGQLALQDRETLYTTGGVVSSTQPPKAKVMHINTATAFYGGIYDGGALLSNRVLQSIPGKIFATPPTFYVDLDDEVVMISSTRNNTIVLGTNSVYRLQGGFNLLGQGAFSYEKISNTMGCISAASVVQTELGIFYAGSDGFYYTDGYQVIKISLDLDISYDAWTKTEAQRARIEGKYDRLQRRIYWKIQSESTTDEANQIWSFYLNYGVKPSGVFAPYSGDATTFRPTALVVYDRQFIKAEPGAVITAFNYDADYDVVIPVAPASLNPYAYYRMPILYKYASCALDYGDTKVGQYATGVHLITQNRGNYIAQFISVTENNNFEGRRALAPINSKLNFWWGYDFPDVWGTEDGMNWKFDGKDDVGRRFTSSSLRSTLRQLIFQPVSTNAYYSYADFQGDVVVNAITIAGNTTMTFTRVDKANYVLLPIEVLGMSISFAIDDYATSYVITAVTNPPNSYSYFTLATQPPWVTAMSQVASQWKIIGQPIHAGFELTSYDVYYTQGVEMGRTVTSGPRGGNGSNR